MPNLTNSVISVYLKNRYKTIQKRNASAVALQRLLLSRLLNKTKNTRYGILHSFNLIKDYNDFKTNVPLSDYEVIKPFIHDMMMGQKNVLWPGVINQFAKSSGTTNDKSKFIPISKENLYKGHIKSSWDSVSILYKKNKNCRVFADKTLILPGSLETFEGNKKTIVGDISAILINNMQAIGKPYYTPDFKTALLPDWEEKIEKTARISTKHNVTMVGGVPTWTILLFKRILELTGKANILEVWPNLSTYMHGGVGFEPYKEIFKKFLPSSGLIFQEIYNASEGYFAVQNERNDPGLLLLTDNGVFYEFIAIEELGTENPNVLSLNEVELNQTYAMVISTNSGLWRYVIGDTVAFTDLDPFKIVIKGRTKQFINAFGEELMIGDAEKALSISCKKHKCRLLNYTAAPKYFEMNSKASHEWLIEFIDPPNNIDLFTKDLDASLQNINSDYEAKRYKSMALELPEIKILKSGTFNAWLRSKGQIGAQRKIPRLSNHRKYITEILAVEKRFT